jgi:hypothetical protein
MPALHICLIVSMLRTRYLAWRLVVLVYIYAVCCLRYGRNVSTHMSTVKALTYGISAREILRHHGNTRILR